MTGRHEAEPDPVAEQLAEDYDRRPLVESVWRLAEPVSHDPRRVARLFAIARVQRRMAAQRRRFRL